MLKAWVEVCYTLPLGANKKTMLSIEGRAGVALFGTWPWTPWQRLLSLVSISFFFLSAQTPGHSHLH